MSELRRTPLYERHRALGARLVDFAGWEMPLLYPTGIITEHLTTRKRAGLFDVSHMGRLAFRGAGAVPFLQHVLSSDVASLEVGMSHYSILPTPTGGAVDDAYLYRFVEDEHLLVVNASNREKDLGHLRAQAAGLADVEMDDRTEEWAMLALQGPESEAVLAALLERGALPPPKRNALRTARIAGSEVKVSRTGYTGEPVCFELIVRSDEVGGLWDRLIEAGTAPVGLGARDTLRLEAGLPLYGHELGEDPEGEEIPIFASRSARSAVSLGPAQGDFVGRAALERQRAAYERIREGVTDPEPDLPRLLQPVTVLGEGVARAGAEVFREGSRVGWVTSGTRAPYWVFEGAGEEARPSERHELRSICLAYVDSRIAAGDRLTVDVRGTQVEAVVVKAHLSGKTPPYARPILQ